MTKIEKGKTLKITYDLYLDGFDGELIESTKKDNPMQFVFGEGEIFPAFEANIKDLKKGDSFQFSITKDEAYGDESEDAIVEFPKDVFLQGDNKQLPKVGDYVPMEDPDGNKFDGIAAEIKDDAIVIDFNHPLSGEDLYFRGTIIDIVDA